MGSTAGLRAFRFGAVASCLFAATVPASAQWSRVAGLPATAVRSVRANGDTITAGADTATYASTDAGATWLRSAKPVAGVTSIEATRIRSGRLYAGTFGQGVYISDDLGATWQAFNEGLVGGILNSQFDISDLQVRGDSLYAATSGAGVYMRSLAGPSAWLHFGDEFEPNQASNVNDLAVGGARLLASAGSNGAVFRRDPGDAEWTISNLDNVGVHAGLQAYSAAWTGTGWVVGTAFGVFRSVAGQEPWTLSSPNLGPISYTSFATRGQQLFAAFNVPNAAVMEQSSDDGATWHQMERLANVAVFELVAVGDDLYAARADGLWRRSTTTPVGGHPGGLKFALAGPQPFGDEVLLGFEMPGAGTASIEVFDVRGVRTAARIKRSWSSGPQQASLDTRQLGSGVYTARLTVGGASEFVRLVLIR
jgi:hypothetical protein